MSSHSATFRTAGFSIACLVLIYVLMVLLQSGDRRVLEGARLWLPFLVASLPPYLIILWRLGERPNDWLGLGLAVAFGTLSVVLLIGYLVAMGSVKEQPALNLFVGILFWHITLLTALVVFVPLQVKLVWNASTTLWASGAGRTVSAIGVSGVLAMAYMTMGAGLLKPLTKRSAAVSDRTEYAASTATDHLFKLYKCLWREAGPRAAKGFPASDEALRASPCWDATTAPGGTAYGTHYAFRYFPGAADSDGVIRSFGMATKKLNRWGTWTDSYYIDHLGIYRHSVQEWATATTDRIESFKHGIVPEFMGMLDAYHDVHGAYPARILHSSQADSAQPNDLVIPERELLARGTEQTASSTIVDCYNARIAYTPVVDPGSGKATAYTFSIRGSFEGIHDLRSYFRSTDGRVHGTGENRDATEADPVAPDIEWVPRLREQTRDRLRTRFGSQQ
jgi:hypothetical protein